MCVIRDRGRCGRRADTASAPVVETLRCGSSPREPIPYLLATSSRFSIILQAHHGTVRCKSEATRDCAKARILASSHPPAHGPLAIGAQARALRWIRLHAVSNASEPVPPPRQTSQSHRPPSRFRLELQLLGPRPYPCRTTAMPKRTFDEMAVIATGAQSFEQRFGREWRFVPDSPPISQWRCNLVSGALHHVCVQRMTAHGTYHAKATASSCPVEPYKRNGGEKRRTASSFIIGPVQAASLTL